MANYAAVESRAKTRLAYLKIFRKGVNIMPGWLDKLTGSGNRIPVSQLQSLAAGGQAVYDAMSQVDQSRSMMAALGTHLWMADEATLSLHLSAWLAEACQAAGAAMMKDGQSAPGYVTELTARQIGEWFDVSSDWAGRAAAAAASPQYHLDIKLPANGPKIFFSGEAGQSDCLGLAAATEAIRIRAEGLLAVIRKDIKLVPGIMRDPLDMAAERVATANAIQDRLKGLAKSPPAVRGDFASQVTEALSGYFWVGQVLNFPRMLGPQYVPAKPVAVSDPRILGPQFTPVTKKPPINLGVLTDPDIWAAVSQDGQRMAALNAYWAADPDPDATVAIQQEINLAEKRGMVSRVPGAAAKQCPWGATYRANRDLQLAGTAVAAGAYVRFYASAGDRRIIPAQYQPPAKVVTAPTSAAIPARPVHHGPQFDPAAPPTAVAPPVQPVHHGPQFDPDATPARPVGPHFDPGADTSAAAAAPRPVHHGPQFDPAAPEGSSHEAGRPEFDPKASGPAQQRPRRPQFDPLADDPVSVVAETPLKGPKSQRFDPSAEY